jgi:hypothetical protein
MGKRGLTWHVDTVEVDELGESQDCCYACTGRCC